MLLLIIGLVLFLGIHSVRMLAAGWREDIIRTRGEQAYKGLYSVISLVGLVLIIIGYGQTRQSPVNIWLPPVSFTHIAALLTLLAFVLLAAAYVPGNRLKAAVGHPMAAGIKVWAFAHLLANGRLGDMVLFGAFLVWAIVNYVLSRRQDREQGKVYKNEKSIALDSITIVVGVGAWLIFALWAHAILIGVSPFGA